MTDQEYIGETQKTNETSKIHHEKDGWPSTSSSSKRSKLEQQKAAASIFVASSRPVFACISKALQNEA
jgi:phage tail tape-measure protein